MRRRSRSYQQALEIDRETLGERHPAYATRLNNLAGLLAATGRSEEAEPLYRQALEIDRETLGERSPDYANRLNNLASLLQSTGRHEEAEPLYRQALEIGRETLGERHPDYGARLNNLAGSLQATRRHEEAERLYRQALEIFRAALGDAHPNTRQVAGNYARLLREYFPDSPALVELRAAFGDDDWAALKAHGGRAPPVDGLGRAARGVLPCRSGHDRGVLRSGVLAVRDHP